MARMIGVPFDTKLVKQLVARRLNDGRIMEVHLAVCNDVYKAMVFIDDKCNPGAPLPSPLASPTDAYSHWIGTNPKVGLSPEEAALIINEVDCENKISEKNKSDRRDRMMK